MVTNKKYSHVKSSLNTGKTMKQVEVMSDRLVSKRISEKFFRVKPKVLVNLIIGFNPGESVYDWKGAQDGQEELKLSDQHHETESIYSMVTDKSAVSQVTVAAE